VAVVLLPLPTTTIAA